MTGAQPRAPLTAPAGAAAPAARTHRLGPGDGVARVQFWLRSAARGDLLLYHRGNLAAARGSSPVVADVAALLGRMEADGQVRLYQRKVLRGGPTLYCAERVGSDSAPPARPSRAPGALPGGVPARGRRPDGQGA